MLKLSVVKLVLILDFFCKIKKNCKYVEINDIQKFERKNLRKT